MELILQVLMTFIVVNTALKLSFWNKWWQPLIFGVICAVFVIVSCKWAIMQSKTQLTAYLNNKQILQNMAVVITIEAVFFFVYCFSVLLTNKKGKPKWWMHILKYYPGILVFFVLFYTLTQSIYNLPGSDFTTISQVIAGIVIIIIPALSLIVRYILPEEEIRLEVHFLVSLFVCIIGLITTVNGNVIYAAAKTQLNIKAIVLSLSSLLAVFFAGIFLDKFKWIIHSKKLKQNKYK